jgi:RNA polymerase sigma-70 factor (ECF subfamily)
MGIQFIDIRIEPFSIPYVYIYGTSNWENLMIPADSPAGSSGETGAEHIFENLYNAFKEDVFRYAVYLAGDSGEAEDLFQETWFRAVRQLSRIGEIHNPRAWLLTITTNLNRDRLRKKMIRRKLFIESRSKDSGGIYPHSSEPVFTERASDPAEKTELGLALQTAISGLPLNQRRVFVLKEIEGFKYKEIKSILRIPEGTAKSLMARAVRNLRKTLRIYREIRDHEGD